MGLEEILKAVGDYLPGALCWNVWKKKNKRRNFENKVTTLIDIHGLTYRSILDWCSDRKDHDLDR